MKLSVFVVTYNQEQYIRQCLDSIVMQQTNFDYEVIIGEDCSTDSTPQICDEYSEKYPFIKVYHHPKNLGLVKNWEFVLNHCQGEFVAMIEGDDYWTNVNKLQMQVDWLEMHPEYVITSTNVQVICEDGLNDAGEWFAHRKEGDVYIEEYIYPGICHTTSVVMRNLTKVIHYPSWIYMTDTFTFMWMAQKGKAYHFDDIMSVYRRHESNCTTQGALKSVTHMTKFADQHRNMQNVFPEIRERLCYYENEDLKYLSTISRRIAPRNLWKYRLRYVWLHKELFFSSFLLRTFLYLPIFKTCK